MEIVPHIVPGIAMNIKRYISLVPPNEWLNVSVSKCGFMDNWQNHTDTFPRDSHWAHWRSVEKSLVLM